MNLLLPVCVRDCSPVQGTFPLQTPAMLLPAPSTPSIYLGRQYAEKSVVFRWWCRAIAVLRYNITLLGLDDQPVRETQFFCQYTKGIFNTTSPAQAMLNIALSSRLKNKYSYRCTCSLVYLQFSIGACMHTRKVSSMLGCNMLVHSGKALSQTMAKMFQEEVMKQEWKENKLQVFVQSWSWPKC